jgi:hypothetical protein
LRELRVLVFVRSNEVGRARWGSLRANREVEERWMNLPKGRRAIDLSGRGQERARRTVIFVWNGDGAMKRKPQRSSARDSPTPDRKTGLPGTPEERRRLLREAMEKNAETLRRLAE